MNVLSQRSCGQAAATLFGLIAVQALSGGRLSLFTGVSSRPVAPLADLLRDRRLAANPQTKLIGRGRRAGWTMQVRSVRYQRAD